MTSPYQPNQPSGQPQHPPYGPPSYGQPSYGPPSYGEPSNSQSPYGSPSGYGPSGGMYAPQPEVPKSATLGIVGLVIVVVAAIALCVLTVQVSQSFTQVMVDLIRRGSDPDLIQTDPAFQRFVESVTGQTGLIMLASAVGLGGWIVSILAVVQRKGRSFGIWGIVLGVLAPIVAFAIFFIIYAGALGQLVN